MTQAVKPMRVLAPASVREGMSQDFKAEPKSLYGPDLTGIRFKRFENPHDVGIAAAEAVAALLAEKPNASIVFPTGKTPLPFYAALRQMPGINWEKSRLFQLDEYVKPDLEGPLPYQTFAEFMQRELWQFVGGQKFYLEQYFDCPLAYESLLTQNGGPDLVILGIGGNGHIAFNEPGADPDSPARLVDLAEQTMQSNFGGVQMPGWPVQAITLGLRGILSARSILMLATGPNKQSIVRRAFDPASEPNLDCPASWLKRHPSVTVMTDFDAGL